MILVSRVVLCADARFVDFVFPVQVVLPSLHAQSILAVNHEIVHGLRYS